METFLENNALARLEYAQWLNKCIYGSKTKIDNLMWHKKWEEFFSNPGEVYNFQEFLKSSTGLKWLKSNQGTLFKKWQES